MPLKVLFITLITFVYNISVQPADLLMHMDIDVKCDQINLFTTGIDITFLLGYSVQSPTPTRIYILVCLFGFHLTSCVFKHC